MTPTWIRTTVNSNKAWHSGLFTLQVKLANFSFKAGQFARLALKDADGELIPRAYSMVSAPGGDIQEFVIARVPHGTLTPRLAALQPGDEIFINSHPSGFFTLDHVPDSSTLWLLATGTGIGPYLSMLKDTTIWQRFSRICLVHGVRTVADLCYADWLQQLTRTHAGQFIYQPVISRDTHTEHNGQALLHGRIPALISSGELEQHCHSVFNANTQVMLCGNPAMIQDTRDALTDKGLQKHLRRKPGQIHMEQYWS